MAESLASVQTRKSTRVARLYDVDDIRIEEVAIPDLGQGDILIKTRACGICTSDLRASYVRSKKRYMFGHEPVGTIVDMNGPVPGLTVGMRVAVHHHAPCMRCHHCLRGEYVHCKVWRSSNIDPGGMSEFFRVPASNAIDVLPVPESMSDEAATFTEPVACAIKAFELARVQPGDRVLVIGLGFMGQLLVALAPYFGASTVIGSDPDPVRRTMAGALGNVTCVDPSVHSLGEQVRELTDGMGADIVVVGPPSTEAIHDGIESAGAGSRVILFSSPSEGTGMSIEPYKLYYKEVSIIPSYSAGPHHTRRALALLAAGALPVDKLVTHRFSFSEVAAAYTTMRRGGSALKSVVFFEE